MKIPARPANAVTGSMFLETAAHLDPVAREERIVAEIVAGNLPSFLRRPVKVSLGSHDTGSHFVELDVMPDYLAIGSDDDFILIPMLAASAQRVATAFDCLLPTEQIVNAIWDAAEVKMALVGQFGVGACQDSTMGSVPCYRQYESVLRAQRTSLGAVSGKLTGGHKKDVIISADIHRPLAALHVLPVIIYGGWERGAKRPIQSSAPFHDDAWVDYSHGIRLVGCNVRVDGQPARLEDVLASPTLHRLISSTLLLDPWYPLVPSARSGHPRTGERDGSASHELATRSPGAMSIDAASRAGRIGPEPPQNADPAALLPAFRERLDLTLADLAAAGTPFRLIEGFRTVERQQWHHGSGRPTELPYGRPGPIVTQLDGVTKLSNHQGNGKPGSGRAADCYPTRNGKVYVPPDADPVWKAYADAARAHGLTAGYYWTSFQDHPHCQLTT